MASVMIDIQVYCENCGAGICDHVSQAKYTEGTIKIEPCTTCMNRKDSEIEELKGRIMELEEQLVEVTK
jgi:hypothetical protein